MELGSEYSLNMSDLTLKEDNLLQYLQNYQCLFFFDSGRSAVRQALSLIDKDCPVLLPEYICESVIRCFPRENISFYRISEDFTVDIEDLKKKMHQKNGILFLMHYFGKLQPIALRKTIQNLAHEKGYTILEDTTHSIFSAAGTIGDYMVCSLRKWMPISRGGVFYTAKTGIQLSGCKLKKSQDNQRITGFVLKDQFLKGRLDCNKEYRAIFRECEKEIEESAEDRLLSDLNYFIIQCVSIDNLIKKRKTNAAYLLGKLKPLFDGLIDYMPDECPFAIPLRVRQRDSFRRILMENRIYCAVHWPFDGFMAESRKQAQRNGEELISLPIDHRYDREHMDYMISVIQKMEAC